MQKREQELLRLLKLQNDWSTSAQLAGALSCSVRTVKSCISGLNERWPGLIVSSHKGFRLTRAPALWEKVQKAQHANHIPQDAESRRRCILRKLLLEKEFYDLDEMAKELCIATSTLSNELCKLRPVLLDFHLMLRTKANRLSIQGSDIDKKRLTSWLICNETRNFISDPQLMNDYFPALDLSLLRRVVTECLARRNHPLDNDSRSILLLNIAISIERNRHAFSSNSSFNEYSPLPISEELRQTVNEFCTALEDQLNIPLTSSDRYGFCALLLARSAAQDTIFRPQALEASVYHLTVFTLERIREVFDLDLDTPPFTQRLALYLQNLLVLHHGGLYLRHPQQEAAKDQHPYIYRVATFAAGTIQQQIGIRISEDEIGYLALHLGGRIDTILNARSRVNALLLFAGYYDAGQELLHRIRRIFENTLAVQEVIVSPHTLDNHPDCALLITTMPVLASMPTVQIGEYLENRDIAVLATRIEDVRRAQLCRRVLPLLRRLLRSDLFWYAPDFTSREDTLRTVARALEQQGYVPDGFGDRLLASESFSSSAVGNLALPYAAESPATASALAVVSFPRALTWGSSRVHLIFLPVLRQEDRPLFRDLFLFFSHVLPQAKAYRELRTADSCEQFLQTLCQNL